MHYNGKFCGKNYVGGDYMMCAANVKDGFEGLQKTVCSLLCLTPTTDLSSICISIPIDTAKEALIRVDDEGSYDYAMRSCVADKSKVVKVYVVVEHQSRRLVSEKELTIDSTAESSGSVSKSICSLHTSVPPTNRVSTSNFAAL